MTDYEAVQALRQGDQGGMDALVERHELRALRLAYQITRDPESAKEVVADAFLAVYEHLSGRAREKPFEPWFVRIVTNRAISVTRRANRYRKVLALLGQTHELTDPEAEAVRNEMHRELAETIRSLPPYERAALAMRYFLDLDERRIAEVLGWPLGTVKTRLHRGRARLRKQLEADHHGLWAVSPMEGD
jgi:RNA polymerase sigma-70 factor (ECF subfamily)